MKLAGATFKKDSARGVQLKSPFFSVYLTQFTKNRERGPNRKNQTKYVTTEFILYCRKTNIFDSMVYMMENYADHLEDLVVKRTGQLIEEKKKTEALVERMLPR